ncbi:MAG: hypothetical protein DELT_02555 [Desulfovibrio sp.]
MLKKAYTTTELMQLFALVKTSVTRRAEREGWKCRKRQGRGGGKEWLFDSMPQGTQLAIRTAVERKALENSEGIVAPQELNRVALSKAVIQAVMEDKRRNKALAKADLLTLYLDWQKKHGFTVKQKEAFVRAYLGGVWPDLLKEVGTKGVSYKSLERWKLQQSEAGTVLALADKRGIAHKGQSILTEQHQLIILGQVLNPNAPTVGECSHKIKDRCKAEGLYVPSEATIRRFVNVYMREAFDEWVMFREGKKAWNDKCAISILRDWNLVEVGDVVIADGHVLNFETLDENGKAKRMTLLLFYDGASNHPLGWDVMASENVACISAAFRRTCMILGKYPKVIYIDNGKAFRAKFFEGTADFRQAGFLGLYRDLGCEVIHAWPYHGQSKPIERFFGTFHEMEVFVPSYTGNSIARKPARMKRNENLHRELYEKMGGRPLTIEETHTAIAAWFCEYVQRPQIRTHLKGRSPAEVFNAGRGPGIDTERLTLMMMQKEIKTIYKDGIKHMGKLFWDQALASRRHSVLIRYDEQFSSHKVLVYTMDGEFICEARDREYYKIATGLHPAARVLGTAEQQQDLADAIALKRGQEKEASAGIREMLHAVVLPEAARIQAGFMSAKATPGAVLPLNPAPKQKALSHEEIKQIEAAKEQARADFDTNSPEKTDYTPAALMRFKDELEKYEYLFNLKYEQGVELVPQDEAWMATFEESAVFQRNYKRRFDDQLELYAFREQHAQVI